MRVAEVMTSEVTTVPSTMPADEAWELMKHHGIHHLVVVDQGRVAGILSARDAGGNRGAMLRATSRVEDLMTPLAVTVDPDATVRRIANLMRGRTIGCVPVLKGEKLVGIVTVSDLLELIGRGMDRPSRPSRRPLHHRVPHRKMNRPSGVW